MSVRMKTKYNMLKKWQKGSKFRIIKDEYIFYGGKIYEKNNSVSIININAFCNDIM